MADKTTQDRKSDPAIDSDIPELPGFDDISLDNPHDGQGTEGTTGKRKPISAKKQIVLEAAKGFGTGLKQATSYELGKKMPNAAATASDIKQTYEDLKMLKDELAQQLGPMMVTLESSGRKLLPKAQKFLPKKLYSKIQKKLDEREQDRKYLSGASVSKEQVERDQIAAELHDIFAVQTEMQMQQFADNKQVQLLDKALGSTRHKQMTIQMTHLYDAVRGTELFHKTQHMAYMKKSLELKYKHLFIARDTFNLLSTSMATFEGYFKAMVENTKLPDMVKVQMGDYHRKMRTEKYGTMMADFLSNMRGKILENLKNAAKSGIDQMSMAVDQLSMGADMSAMGDEMGMGDDKKKVSPIWNLAAQGLGWAVGGPKAKSMLDRITPFTRDFDKSMKNLRGNAALKAANLKRKWSYGNPLQQMIAGLLPEGFAPRESTSNDLLTKPHDPATFDVMTRQSIVEIIPGYLGKILHSLEKSRTGDENAEEVAFNVYSRKFTTTKELKQDMMVKMYGDENQRRRVLAPILGTMQAGMEHKSGKDESDRIKGFEKDLNKVFFNYAWRGELFDPEKIRTFLMADDKERALRDPHISKVFAGLDHDPVEVARLLYDSVFTEDGKIDKRLVEEIDDKLRSYRELDTYKTELPRAFETYGYRHLMSSKMNSRDEAIVRKAAKEGNKEAIALLRKNGGMVGDDNRTNFDNMIADATNIDYDIKDVSAFDLAHSEVGKSMKQSDRDRGWIADKMDAIKANKVVGGALAGAASVAKGGKAFKDWVGRHMDELYDYYQESGAKPLGDRLSELASGWKASAAEGLKRAGIVTKKPESKPGSKATAEADHVAMMREWEEQSKRADAESALVVAKSAERIAKLTENLLGGHVPPTSARKAIVQNLPPPESPVLNTVMPMVGVGAGSRERGGSASVSMSTGSSSDDDGGGAGGSSTTADILQKFFDLYKYNEDFRTEQIDDWKTYVSDEHGVIFDALAQIDDGVRKAGMATATAAGGQVSPDQFQQLIASMDPQYKGYLKRKKFIRGAAGAIGKGIKGVGKMYTKIYGAALQGAGTAIAGISGMIGKGLDKAEKAGKWLVSKQQYVDVYRKSDHKLLVTARQQREEGIYFAESMKRVERSSDITEPCLDKNAEYIITKEDLADGLEMNDSSPLGRIGAGLLTLGKGYLGLYGKAISAIGKIGKAVVQGFIGKTFDKYCDVYIKGKSKDKPILTRLKQSRDPGVIFKNGSRVERTSDIREPVYDPVEKDAAGQPLVLISEDDLKEGLVDVNDKPLGTGMGGREGILGKMMDIGKSFGEFAGKGALKGMDLYSYIYKNLFDIGVKGIKGVGKGIGKFLGGGLGAFMGYDEESKNALITMRDYLAKIQADVSTLVNKDKPKAGDLDGDGDIDGSYADQQEKKAKEGKPKAERVQASDLKHNFHNWTAEAGGAGGSEESGGLLDTWGKAKDMFGKVKDLFGGGGEGGTPGGKIPGLGKLGDLLGKGGGKFSGMLGSLGRGISKGGGRLGGILGGLGSRLAGGGRKLPGKLGLFSTLGGFASTLWNGKSEEAANADRWNLINKYSIRDDETGGILRLNRGAKAGEAAGKYIGKFSNGVVNAGKRVANVFSKDNMLNAGRSVMDMGRNLANSRVGNAISTAGRGIGKVWGKPFELAGRGAMNLGRALGPKALGLGSKIGTGLLGKLGGAAGAKAGLAALGGKAAGLAGTLGANIGGFGSALTGALGSVGLGPLAAGAAALYGGYRMAKGFTAKETMDNLGIKDERDVLFEDRMASALGFNTKIGAKAMRGLQSISPIVGLIKGIRGNDNPMTEKEVEQGRNKLQRKVDKGLPGYDKILSEYEKALEDHNWSRARQLCGKEADGIITSMWKHSITGKVVTGLGNLFFGKKDEEMSKEEIDKVRAKFESLAQKGGSAGKNAEKLLSKFDDYVAEGDWKNARKLAGMEKRGLIGKLFQNSDGSVKWGSVIGSALGPAGYLLGSLFNSADVNKPMTEEEVKKARERLQKMIDNGNTGAQKILDKFDEYVTQMNWKKARELVGERVRSNLEKLDSGLKSTAKWATRIGTLGLSMLFEQDQNEPMSEQEIKKFTDKMNFLIEKHNDKLAEKKLEKFEQAVAAQNWEKARKIAKMPHKAAIVRAAKATWSFFWGDDEKEMTEQEMTKFRESMQRKIEIGGAIGRAAQKKLDAFEDAVGAQRWKRARTIADAKDDGIMQSMAKGVGGAIAAGWRFFFGGDGKPMSEGEIADARKELEGAVTDGKKNAQKRLDLFNDYVADEKWEKARRLAKMPYENAAKRSLKAVGNWLFGNEKEALSPQEIDKFQKECEQKIADAGGNDPQTEKILEKFNQYVEEQRWDKARAVSNLKAGGAWGTVKGGLKSAWNWLTGKKDYEDCQKMKEEIEEKAMDDETGIINKGLEQFETLVRRQKYNEAAELGEDLLKLKPAELASKHKFTTDEFEEIGNEATKLQARIDKAIKQEGSHFFPSWKEIQLKALKNKLANNPSDWNTEFLEDIRERFADITGQDEFDDEDEPDDEIVKKGKALLDDVSKTSDNFSWLGSPFIKKNLSALKDEIEGDISSWSNGTINKWRSKLREIAGEDTVDSRSDEEKSADASLSAESEEEALINEADAPSGVANPNIPDEVITAANAVGAGVNWVQEKDRQATNAILGGMNSFGNAVIDGAKTAVGWAGKGVGKLLNAAGKAYTSGAGASTYGAVPTVSSPGKMTPTNATPSTPNTPIGRPDVKDGVVLRDGSKVSREHFEYYGEERLLKEPWLQDVDFVGDPDDEMEAREAYELQQKAGFENGFAFGGFLDKAKGFGGKLWSKAKGFGKSASDTISKNKGWLGAAALGPLGLAGYGAFKGLKSLAGHFQTKPKPEVDADGNPLVYGEAGTEAIMPIRNKPGNLLSRVSNKLSDLLFGKQIGPMKDSADSASVHAGTDEAEPMENMMANEIAKSIKPRMATGGFVKAFADGGFVDNLKNRVSAVGEGVADAAFDVGVGALAGTAFVGLVPAIAALAPGAVVILGGVVGVMATIAIKEGNYLKAATIMLGGGIAAPVVVAILAMLGIGVTQIGGAFMVGGVVHAAESLLKGLNRGLLPEACQEAVDNAIEFMGSIPSELYSAVTSATFTPIATLAKMGRGLIDGEADVPEFWNKEQSIIGNILNTPGRVVEATGALIGNGMHALGKGVGKLFGFGGDEQKAEATAETQNASTPTGFASGGFIRDRSLLTMPSDEDSSPIVPPTSASASMASSAAKISEAVAGMQPSTSALGGTNNAEMIKKLSEVALANKKLIEMLSAVLTNEGVKIQGMETLTEVCALPSPGSSQTTQIIQAPAAEESGLDLRKRQA